MQELILDALTSYIDIKMVMKGLSIYLPPEVTCLPSYDRRLRIIEANFYSASKRLILDEIIGPQKSSKFLTSFNTQF